MKITNFTLFVLVGVMFDIAPRIAIGSDLAQQDEVAIDARSGVATLPCPQPGYLNNSDIIVSVNYDRFAKKYSYKYSVSSTTPQSRSIGAIFFRDLAKSEVKAPFKGFAFCQIDRGFLGCINDTAAGNTDGLTLISDAPPGIVRYEIESESSPIFTDKVVSALLPFFRNDVDSLYEAVQESAGEQCSSGKIKSMSERRVSGITTGPSDMQAGTLLIDVKPNDVDGTTAIDVRNDSTGVDAIAPKSVAVYDSLGNLLLLEPSDGLSSQNRGRSRALMEGKYPHSFKCNVKGIYAEGLLLDGRKARIGAKISGPACSPLSQFFAINLPKR